MNIIRSRTRNLIWLALVAWALPAAAQQGPDLVVQIIGHAVSNPGEIGPVRTAVNRFRNRDFNGARQLFEQAKQAHPELPPAGVLIARLHNLANESDAARAALEGVVRENPNDPEAYLLLGDGLQRSGHVVASELMLRRGLELNAGLTGAELRKNSLELFAHLGLAGIAERRENWAAAREHLDKAMKLNPRHVGAVTRLARAVYRANSSDKQTEQLAFRILEDLSKHVSAPVPPEVQMASLCHQEGKQDAARAWFDRVIQRQPKDISTRLIAARWALDARQIPLAREHVDAALAVDDKSFDVLMMAGLAARFQKDYAVAEQLFERCTLLRPGEFQPLHQLTLALIEQATPEKQEKALTYARMLSRLYADMASLNGRDAAVTFGWVMFLTDRGTEAQASVQSAISRGEVSPESQYFAARILHDTGQSDSARELLSSALGQTSAFPTIQEAEQLKARL